MAQAATPVGEGNVIILVDASGSMKESAGNGATRMEAAKVGLGKVIEALPADAKVGLRAYGSTIEDGAKSCKDSELLVPVQAVDKAKLTAGVKKLKPLGNTPIAYSLEKAAKDLPASGTRSIVLVSDGEENCNGDPCKVAKDISASGTKLHVDVIGLQVDAKSRNQLTCIASAGGGTYYDVPDVTSLPKTLTRASVRGARGYEPAGKPVEGGTSGDGAVEIADGQWLDTVGDSDVEFYRILDPGKGTLHLAATVRPVGLGTADGMTVEVQVTAKSGTECGSGARADAIGLFTKNSPITAAYTLTAADRVDCGAGPYTMSVNVPRNTGVKPLEVLVSSEAAVKTAAGLPVTAIDTDWAAQGDSPSVDVTPVIGSPSFSGAPKLAPGTYSDSILGAETLFYAVDVDWGQQLVCDATIGANPQADPYGVTSVSVQAYGFQRGIISQPSDAEDDQAFYESDKDVTVHATTPPVRYLNREASADPVKAASMAGTYYCAVFINAGVNQVAGLGEMPVTLNVSTVGAAGEGEPDYLAEPASAKNADKSASADSSMGVGVFAGIGVAILALLALVWAILRRRRAHAA